MNSEMLKQVQNTTWLYRINYIFKFIIPLFVKCNCNYHDAARWYNHSTNVCKGLGFRTIAMAWIHKAKRHYHSGKRDNWRQRLSLVARCSIRGSDRWWITLDRSFKQHSKRNPTNAGNKSNTFEHIWSFFIVLFQKTKKRFMNF